MNTRRLPRILWISLAALMPGAALAGEDSIAVIKRMEGSVTVERAQQMLPAQVGMDLRVADRIITGSNGAAGLTFDDNSLMSLGPSSQLALNRFQFNSTTHVGQFETTLARGRMAVVSGKIAKQQADAMKVRTPQSLLGVRGTEFIVEASQ